MTKQRKALIEHMRQSGATVFLSLEDGIRHYAMSDSSKPASEGVIRGLIEAGVIVPDGHSMFGGEAQVYKLEESA